MVGAGPKNFTKSTAKQQQKLKSEQNHTFQNKRKNMFYIVAFGFFFSVCAF